jgi:hypothetical protein
MNDKGKEVISQYEYKEQKWIGFANLVEALELNKELTQEIMNACYRV